MAGEVSRGVEIILGGLEEVETLPGGPDQAAMCLPLRKGIL